jgi:SPX domain protein involved in polyphosphate accumulation
MADRMNLVVDYEDQADWLQDSIVVENVISGQNHDQLIVELEQAVYDNTRSMYNPPSSHIRIMGFAPADSDVVVKRGVNFWVDSENIFAQ